MSEQLPGQISSASFVPEAAAASTISGVVQAKPAVRRTTGFIRTNRRLTTMSYLLEELQQPQSNIIPDKFGSVDRRLPVPPAAAILQRAIGICYAHFVDFSEQARAVQEHRELLLEAICSLADANQRPANAEAMAQFETRMFGAYAQNAIVEINNAYRHLARLLQEEPSDRSLPWQSRLLAVSHFLAHAAKPETLCQGNKIGSHVLCLAQKLVTSNPAKLADMLACAALDGAWQTFDEKTVVVDEHSLKPGIDEILYKPGDNQRSYAGKIFQCLMLNNCLRRRSKPMAYSETPGRPGRHYGGQIVRTVDGEFVDPKLGANLTYLELALLARFEFNFRASVVVNDASFVPHSPECNDQVSKQPYIVHIKSAEQLGQFLLRASEHGALPVMIAVDERRLLAESYKDGINQCISVLSYNEGMVKIFNPQLLPGMQRTARINLQRLYNATLSSAKA